MFPRDVLSTGALLLRPSAESDAGFLAAAGDDPEIARFFFRWPSPFTLQAAREHLRGAAERWALGGADYAITRDGAHLGAITLSPVDDWGTCAIGYWVAPSAQGQGVAAQAVRALTDWALDHGALRVELEAEVENLASLRTAYKAGFQQEGIRREARVRRDGVRVDLVLFSRVPGDPGVPAERYLPPFPGGRLDDGVVRLVPLGAEHTEDLHALFTEPSVAGFAPVTAPPLHEMERRCRYTGYYWLSGQRVEVAVTDATSGAFAGHLQLRQVAPVTAQATLGYSLVPGFRGRGFISRALALVVDWAFSATRLRRITAGTDVANAASQRVLERAGFTRVRTHRGLLPVPGSEEWKDDVEWVLLHPKLRER
ncbi:GNAT family N-acetyltransferase [Nonomuraea longicatena]|uniref:N-acetyltransferase domain-containing protein n=1 Tax=Nonomuraea longicatena TaxID=83682 RepID=A0ABN1NZ27_9ACTN